MEIERGNTRAHSGELTLEEIMVLSQNRVADNEEDNLLP